MPSWSHNFAFSVGDRVAVAVPAEVKATDKQWASFDGRYGTVGKVLMETEEGGGLFVRYRVELEITPRGKAHILWCREDYVRKARKGKQGGE